MPATEPPRRFNRSYEGRLGFSEAIEPPTVWAKELSILNKHRTAKRVLKQHGTYLPSAQQLIELGKDPPKTDELQALKQLIKGLKERHSDNLERLCASQAQDYLQEARDRYAAKDDTQHLVKGENNPTLKMSYGKLENLYKETRKGRAYASEWDDEVDRLRVAHLKQLLPLEKRRAELEKQEEAARQRRDAQFPGSYQEYDSIQNKDIQLRVARFLVGDSQRQDAIMTQFGWAWRQVQPLKDEYSRNSEFQAQVLEALRQFETQDPRRPSMLG